MWFAEDHIGGLELWLQQAVIFGRVDSAHQVISMATPAQSLLPQR